MIVNPKPSGYLQEIDIEALARMNAALISELWIMRDRLAVLEQLLEERGVLAPEEINDYTPREPFASKLAALRQVVVGSIVGRPSPMTIARWRLWPRSDGAGARPEAEAQRPAAGRAMPPKSRQPSAVLTQVWVTS